MKTLFTSLLIALCLLNVSAPQTQAQSQYVDSGWMHHANYQLFFDARLYGNSAPTFVEARLNLGDVEYRAVFGAMPPGYSTWGTHHAMSDAAFAQTNQNYLSRGYTLHQHQRLIAAGRAVNQGIWYR